MASTRRLGSPMSSPASPRYRRRVSLTCSPGNGTAALHAKPHNAALAGWLRGKSETVAFIDLGDQFIALQVGRTQPADDGRHVGLVVDDKEAARAALKAAGVKLIGGPFLDFRDPWGNRIETVGYENIQFTKAPNVLRHGSGATDRERKRAEGAGGKRNGGRLIAVADPCARQVEFAPHHPRRECQPRVTMLVSPQSHVFLQSKNFVAASGK
jgi:hypothetical protein